MFTATETMLELNRIKETLKEYALSDKAKERLDALTPYMEEAQCLQKANDTSSARKMIDTFGTPPLTSTAGMESLLVLCRADSMLLPDQLESVVMFAACCKRLGAYLARGEETCGHVAAYGKSLADLGPLRDEIERCIRNGQVDSDATPALRGARKKIEQTQSQIKEKLASILRGNPQWFSDGYVSQKHGHYVLPVKKEYRSRFSGSVIDTSGSGGTCFMEPASVAKLQSALAALEIEAENEERRILYTLSAMVQESTAAIRLNMEVMEELDFIFAKGKLSAQWNGIAPELSTDGVIRIVDGRHPLLDKNSCVPLNFSLGEGVRGVVITGPNTGGKTVALKTVGLLCLLAQCGLHIPAGEGTVTAMHGNYLCDIGDGQSISQNLSTFSGHMKNVIAILENTTPESLVLMDELGSGTDPAEGMGIAVAVLEELRGRGCRFLVTTHYPQVKDYAEKAEGVQSARMAFDRETLSPLYRLELGRSGESCALHIARKLGLPEHLLERAYTEAYHAGQTASGSISFSPGSVEPAASKRTFIKKRQEPVQIPPHAAKFRVGDSVTVYPEREIGIIWRLSGPDGMLGVQVKGDKRLISHKRVKLKVAAAELYPEDYDMSVVLDSVANRKARHQMGKKHRPDLVIDYGDTSK